MHDADNTTVYSFSRSIQRNMGRCSVCLLALTKAIPVRRRRRREIFYEWIEPPSVDIVLLSEVSLVQARFSVFAMPETIRTINPVCGNMSESMGDANCPKLSRTRKQKNNNISRTMPMYFPGTRPSRKERGALEKKARCHPWERPSPPKVGACLPAPLGAIGKSQTITSPPYGKEVDLTHQRRRTGTQAKYTRSDKPVAEAGRCACM